MIRQVFPHEQAVAKAMAVNMAGDVAILELMEKAKLQAAEGLRMDAVGNAATQTRVAEALQAIPDQGGKTIIDAANLQRLSEELDAAGATRYFLRHLTPEKIQVIESEIWDPSPPERIATAPGRYSPMGGMASDTSRFSGPTSFTPPQAKDPVLVHEPGQTFWKPYDPVAYYRWLNESVEPDQFPGGSKLMEIEDDPNFGRVSKPGPGAPRDTHW